MKIKSVQNIVNISKKQGDAVLYRFLKKHYIADMYQLESVIKKLPTSKKIVGTLPYPWIKNVEKKEISDVTVKIGKCFEHFVNNLSKNETTFLKDLNIFGSFSLLKKDSNKNFLKVLYEKTISKFKDNKFLKKFREKKNKKGVLVLEKQLSKILKKDVNVSNLSIGMFGRTFLLEVDGHKSVLKTFLPQKIYNAKAYYNEHGKGAEFTRGLFAKKNAQKNIFAKLYFGKITTSDKKDNGFMLLQFVDEKNAKPYSFKVHNNIFSKVYSADSLSIGNMIGGTIVDYGAIKVNRDLLSHKKMKIARLMQKAIDTDNKKLFDDIFRRYEKDQDFQEILIYLNKKLNKIYKSDYSKSGVKASNMQSFLDNNMFDFIFYKRTKEALYMYEKLGLNKRMLDILNRG